jgi:hypothetical protein
MTSPLGDPSLVEFFISERRRESEQESRRIGLESETRPTSFAPARSSLGSETGALGRVISFVFLRRNRKAVA